MEGAMGAAPDGTPQDRIPVILTHEGVSSVWKQRAARGPATRDVEHRNRIAEHVERTLGTKIELFISERQPCHGLTVDVLVVPPTDERPFYVLVTRGLSEMHMNVHPLAKHSPSRIELVICLPKTWEVSLEAFRKSEQFFWPVRQLKRHALFPAIHNTFISLGHTVANELVNDDIPPSPDNPSRPFCSNTTMNSMLMMVPALLPEEFHIMTVKKPNKKKKKRTRKRDKTEANGQREDAAARGSADAAKDGAGKAGTDVGQSQQATGETNGNDKATNRQQEGEREKNEKEGEKNEREGGEEARPEGEDTKEDVSQQPQEGENKKKGRRKRGGKKKKNKKNGNGESNKQGEEATTKEGEESSAADDRKAEPGEEAGKAIKGKEKENETNQRQQQQQQQGQKRNEEPFRYGENKEDVYFYQLLPLYQEEVDFKLKHGLECLLERLEQLPPLDVMTITPGRRNVCQMPVKRKILRAKRRTSPKGPGGASQAPESSPSGAGGETNQGGSSSSGSSLRVQQEQEPEDEGQDQHHQPVSQEKIRVEGNNANDQDHHHQLQPEREKTGGTVESSAAKAREDVSKTGTNGKGNEHK